ncbi:hypothetical protein FHR84_000853 [Actinopolyspora biskrensis]|uniref:Uncharacterized protein n=1 Tax=Actinopolyspora biskrensis TaxID=1470178 RepID=A0A852YVE5_9ACTN|nr:hypothetical protein [Actinopolyspora biskrensis]
MAQPLLGPPQHSGIERFRGARLGSGVCCRMSCSVRNVSRRRCTPLCMSRDDPRVEALVSRMREIRLGEIMDSGTQRCSTTSDQLSKSEDFFERSFLIDPW